jgi:hypothetical protein
MTRDMGLPINGKSSTPAAEAAGSPIRGAFRPNQVCKPRRTIGFLVKFKPFEFSFSPIGVSGVFLKNSKETLNFPSFPMGTGGYQKNARFSRIGGLIPSWASQAGQLDSRKNMT